MGRATSEGIYFVGEKLYIVEASFIKQLADGTIHTLV